MERAAYKIHEAVEELHCSTEYRKYMEMKHNLEAQPDLRKQVDAYRRAAYILQSSAENGTMTSKDFFNEMEKIENEYSGILHNSDVAKYLDLEYSICAFLRRSIDTLVNAADIAPDEVTEHDG